MIKTLFFNNYLLMLPLVSWLCAQIIKTIIDFLMNRKFSSERLVGSGGMPSSHSALVCSLVVGCLKKYGPSSPWFAFSLVLALIVMYDAMGVRQETGKQAKVLNTILADFMDDNFAKTDFDIKLKEMVGHTPLQVFFGALLGIVLGIIVPVF